MSETPDLAAAAEANWIWIGKVAPPSSEVDAVPRTALLERLAQQAAKPLVMLEAPPGFGKTTLLTQWRDRLAGQTPPVPVAWLSLDEDDRAPHRFLAYLVLALERAGVPLESLAPLARSHALDANPQHTLAIIVAALGQGGRRVTLILDDYHRASSAEVDAAVLMLIERASHWLQLVLASRGRPRLPVATLQARGLLYRIDAADLVLSGAETSAILGDAAGDAAALVHERTEGWAVAVQLAKLWLARDSAALSGLEQLSGHTGEIAGYLTEQVLEALPPDCREFLIETSLLERFSVEMADEVRGRGDSAAHLLALASYRALLVPLDAQRRWHRYHPLLADFLRARLDPARARTLHRAAAHWLAKQSDCLLAVRHAQRAGDQALAVSLVRAAGGWELVLRKGIAYTQSLLNEFDELQRRSEPALLLMQAYLNAKLGNEALAFEMLRLAEAGLAATPQLRSDYLVIEFMVYGYFDRPREATLCAAPLPDGLSILGRACVLNERAMAALANAHLPDAVRQAQEARVQMQLAHCALGEAYVLLNQAQAEALSGNVRMARSQIDTALALAEANFGTESSLKSMVGCYRAQHLYWSGAWSEAWPWATAALEPLHQTDGWLEVCATSAEILWRSALRLDGLAAALRQLDQSALDARQRQLPRLGRLVQAWRIDLLVQSSHVAQAQQEARAAGLVDWTPPRGVTDNWREYEAVSLALGRLAAAQGASEAAAAGLRRGAQALDGAGLRLCAWRLEGLAWALGRRDADSPAAQEGFRHWMQSVWAQNLHGLLLEIGAGLLPRLQSLDPDGRYAAWPGLAALVTRLRGWQVHPPRHRSPLSAKEEQVLALVAAGQGNKMVANALGVSENTVKFHLKQIFLKLGVGTRTAAIAVALQNGYIDAVP
ncbi:LuxR C-terminal-related transcriptional regulator [Massilia cavernae]|uniref:LuxR family transcriptional regulator n=1 Tax=Massilia cavernae TaxID=2320864 RepID=A0A418XS29_9BURK|nr:LuxR C-terminal-related transcriptional regulator [Massilia cavernae]RJG15364.1 LuxR family transcriptional regulator [Massilia cavernae]